MNRLLNQLRLRQLHMVCMLADTGSVRAAAQRMNLSAPALSKSLRELESVLGQSLFVRTAQGMVLTVRGDTFVRSARAVIGELHAEMSSAGNVSGEEAPVLRIGAMPYAIWSLMPGVLRSVREQGESARLVGTPGGLSSLTEQLTEGEIDVLVALRSPETLSGIDSALVEIVPLFDDELLIMAAPGLLPHTPPHLGWADLQQMPWILPPRRTRIRMMVESAFFDAGLRPPEPLVDAAQVYGCVRMAAEGLGVTAAPRSALTGSGLQNDIEVFDVAPRLGHLSLILIYRRACIGRRSLRLVIDAMRRAGETRLPEAA